MIKPLSPDRLRYTYDPQQLDFNDEEDFRPSEGIIGQHRAVSALDFGLNIEEIGFNIYVAGPRGIGKMTAVKSFLEDLARRKPAPSDWCYVNNFSDPYQPTAIGLPQGMGKNFQNGMQRFTEHVRKETPKLFESEEYGSRRDELLNDLNAEREAIFKTINRKANEQGFLLQASSMGIMLLPAKEGKPMQESEWNTLSPEAQNEKIKIRERLQEELKEAVKQTQNLERKVQEALQEMDRQIVLFMISGLLNELREIYREHDGILQYLDALQEDLLSNIEIIKADAQTDPNLLMRRDAFFKKFTVNLIIDNSRQEGAPVVMELNPTYNNLFGRVEKESYMGGVYTDFTMIRGGSLHRANGGFIVLPVEDVLRNFMSWDGLKRALRSGSITIEELSESMGFTVAKSLRPQPIPLNIKVILVGRPVFYYLMHSHDEEFPELFRVKADFDTSMPRNKNNIRDFLMFLRMICRKENLKPLDRGAAARMLEHAARFADDQEKISTHFGAMADVIREAHFWASKAPAAGISRVHIQKALDEKFYRSSLVLERIQELILRDVFLIATDGAAIGQVNGLAVMRMGEFEFGRPSRITVSVAPGTEGVIDIERQVDLGGRIHSKGVLILSGYLLKRFAQKQKLSLAARIAFEQSYEGVDGDSASSTEYYALISALSGVPVKQGIAVTGSVDQNGTVQAIGGVNQKIEGFYDICCLRGLTGQQGVIIPKANVHNLMLREDIVESARNGQFHIWAVNTVEEGLEILTGRKAGVKGPQKAYTRRSLYYLTEKKLKEFSRRLRTESSKSKATKQNATRRRQRTTPQKPLPKR